MSPAHSEIVWAGTKAQAVIIGPYRYWWHRKFPDGKGVCVFGMLNPSIANRDRHDPTTRRVCDFARQWGYNSVVIVNLYAAIATEPDDLLEMDNPVGPRNEEFINYALDLIGREGGFLCVAWGAHRLAKLREEAFMELVNKRTLIAHHLGITKEGGPRHPLYAPANTEPALYGER